MPILSDYRSRYERQCINSGYFHSIATDHADSHSVDRILHFAPLILVILLVYLQLNLQRMWEALATLPAKFPDGRSVDERVYPWVYIQRVPAHYPWLQYTYAARVENGLGSVLGYLAVPATIVVSCRRVAVTHSFWLITWHVVLFAVAVLIGLLPGGRRATLYVARGESRPCNRSCAGHMPGGRVSLSFPCWW